MLDGLDGGKDDMECDAGTLMQLVEIPTYRRLFAVQAALERGFSVEEVSRLSRIDRWFLSKLQRIAATKKATMDVSLDQLDAYAMRQLKCLGFSDRQIARYTHNSELVVSKLYDLLYDFIFMSLGPLVLTVSEIIFKIFLSFLRMMFELFYCFCLPLKLFSKFPIK